jgi:hypothetical protein
VGAQAWAPRTGRARGNGATRGDAQRDTCAGVLASDVPATPSVIYRLMRQRAVTIISVLDPRGCSLRLGAGHKVGAGHRARRV